MSDGKFLNSRLAKSEKYEFLFINDAFQNIHKVEVAFFVSMKDKKSAKMNLMIHFGGFSFCDRCLFYNSVLSW